jgi:hypothetical protein
MIERIAGGILIETNLCTWCLGMNGVHHPNCYVGKYLARIAGAAAVTPSTPIPATNTEEK